MITQPILLAGVLIGLVCLILHLEKHPSLAPVFHYLPAPFWCYFIPMLLSTLGVLPEKSAVYSFLTTYVLSGILILLLLNVNLPGILRLGPTALGALVVGSLGIACGAVGSFAVFGRWLPPETWKGVGALSASWIGGSANMLAVKEALQTPDSVFAPMIIVDTVMTYTWMGIMIALAAFQDRWDNWVKADRSTLDEALKRLGHPVVIPGGRTPSSSSPAEVSGGSMLGSTWILGLRPPRMTKGGTAAEDDGRATSWLHAIWLIGGSMLIGVVCLRVGEVLPAWGGVLNRTSWAYILVTLIGVLLSLSPASRLEAYGASRWGYLCLYVLLAALGSKARLQYILQAPLLIVMAAFWVAIHAAFLALYGRLRRVPMFFLAAASQADIGGTASAPIVAGVYQPRLASIGLLLAIGANVVGTYCGILIAHACRWTHP